MKDNKLVFYLASPLWTDDQKDTLDKVEGFADDPNSGYICLSPRRMCGVLDKNAPKEVREKQATDIFKKNVEGIRDADFILACVDDKDIGTAWELGMGYGMGNEVISFSKHNRPTNLMLAKCVTYHFTNLDVLFDYLKTRSESGDLSKFIEYKGGASSDE